MLAPSPFGLGPLALDERWRKLGRMAFTRLVLSAASAVGAKLGAYAIDALIGDDEADEEEPPVDDPPNDGEDGES